MRCNLLGAAILLIYSEQRCHMIINIALVIMLLYYKTIPKLSLRTPMVTFDQENHFEQIDG